MDIATITNHKSDRDHFIDENFSKVEYGLDNPLLVFKVNYTNKADSLKFCTMSTKQCWVKKDNDLYAFFILIQRNSQIDRNISAVYGPCNASTLVTTEGLPIGDGVRIWKQDHLNIYVQSYFNPLRIPDYEKCDLIVCGNMTLEQLTDRSGK